MYLVFQQDCKGFLKGDIMDLQTFQLNVSDEDYVGVFICRDYDNALHVSAHLLNYYGFSEVTV
jgi:hypothetical protein